LLIVSLEVKRPNFYRAERNSREAHPMGVSSCCFLICSGAWPYLLRLEIQAEVHALFFCHCSSGLGASPHFVRLMPTLHWIGKEKVVTHHLDVPFRVLNHKYQFKLSETIELPESSKLSGSLPSENKIIKGDNLEALKALLPYYEGRIKCIYIDPPYNTGNEGWIYNDNVNDPKIKRWLGKVVGKESEDLTRHDKWLCMMYPRLQLLHKLLADDGAIFVSIDDNEQANLKLMMDEIWGAGNFINNIIWQKKYSPQNDARYFSDMHDFILCYAKKKSFWERKLTPRSVEQNARYKNPDNDKKGVWKATDFSVKTYAKNYDYPITTPSGKIINPPDGRCWATSKENFEKLVEENKIWFGKDGNNVPSLKKYLHEVQDGTVPVTLWLREEVGDNQEAKQELKKIFHDSTSPFDTPKPPRLINRILQIATNPNDIILDSFAGSGTTAHAVLNLNKQDGGNRKFILVEMEDYAERITAERIRRVIDGYGTTEGTGGSFSYYELGEPLFNEDQQLNENLPVAQLRDYIWYTETRSPLPQSTESPEAYFMGKHYDTAYYFVYEKDQITTLDYEFLATVEVKAASYVIFADNCLIPRDFMAKHHLIFKKIPRDISRF
jgi:adenine-specific DNA-methyltransferase